MPTRWALKSPTRLGCTTCTAMYSNGASIITERITTNGRPQATLKVQFPAITVFYGAGRGAATRVALVPLAALGSSLLTVTSAATAVFGWFVSWISSVGILYLCNSASLNSERGCRRLRIGAPVGYFPCPARGRSRN